MKFKVGNKIYSFAFLQEPSDFKLRYTETEGIVLCAPEEIDVLMHGEPTGEKTIVWNDTLTYATGEDAAKIWAALTRVLVSENMLLDVDNFLANVAGHDEAVAAARDLLVEEQRIRAEGAREKLEELRGLSVAQIRAMQRGPVRDERPPLLFMPPPSGGGGSN